MACPPSVDNNIQMDEDMAHDVDQDDEQIPYIGSMTLAVEPSCDWRLQFGKISNEDEARRYYECFKVEKFIIFLFNLFKIFSLNIRNIINAMRRWKKWPKNFANFRWN